MATKSIHETMNQYAALMEEVKVRLAAINHCTLGNFHVPPPLVKEFCYLQIRMICELMALGCLVAHGDEIEETKSKGLQKLWEADKIMNALEGLHDDFYPTPIDVDRSKEEFIDVIAKASPLPKAEFLSMYGKCGGTLHKGNARNLLKSGHIPARVSYPEITQKAQKILDLLNNHVLVMHGRERMIGCSLHFFEGGNVVVVNANVQSGSLPHTPG